MYPHPLISNGKLQFPILDGVDVIIQPLSFSSGTTEGSAAPAVSDMFCYVLVNSPKTVSVLPLLYPKWLKFLLSLASILWPAIEWDGVAFSYLGSSIAGFPCQRFFRTQQEPN